MPPLTPRGGLSVHPRPRKYIPRPTLRSFSAISLDGGQLRAQDPRPVRMQLTCAPPVTPSFAIMRRWGCDHGAPPTRGPEEGSPKPQRGWAIGS